MSDKPEITEDDVERLTRAMRKHGFELSADAMDQLYTEREVMREKMEIEVREAARRWNEMRDERDAAVARAEKAETHLADIGEDRDVWHTEADRYRMDNRTLRARVAALEGALRNLYDAFPDCDTMSLQCRHGHPIVADDGTAGEACRQARIVLSATKQASEDCASNAHSSAALSAPPACVSSSSENDTQHPLSVTDETQSQAAAELSVAERVKKVVVKHLGVEEDKVTENASLIDDLGADSHDTVELVMELEEEFGIEIPDEDAEKILTVKDAISAVKRLDRLASGEEG